MHVILYPYAHLYICMYTYKRYIHNMLDYIYILSASGVITVLSDFLCGHM